MTTSASPGGEAGGTDPSQGARTVPGVRRQQPWSDASLAELYDLFPFEADIPFYLDLAASQGGRVLELACGTGRVLVPLAASGARVTGIDASTHMLDIARRKLEAAGPRVAERAGLTVSDLTEFDLGERFDSAIIAVKSFAYLTDRAVQLAALERVASHLRPGGIVAIDLLHPTPEWLAIPDGSVRQDLMEVDAGETVTRTETVVSTDLAAQVRVLRSVYDITGTDGTVRRRIVEWPFRYTFRFEAELLLERAGFDVQTVYGGYDHQPFDGRSDVMLFVARRQ